MQEARGYFYDGLTPQRHEVIVRLSMDRLALEIVGEGVIHRWALADLRGIRDQEKMTLTVVDRGHDHQHRESMRLVLLDETAADWVRRTRPNLYRADHAPKKRGKLWMRVAAAAVALYGLVIFILPALADKLAQFVPVKNEVALGHTAIEQFKVMLYRMDAPEDIMCNDPKGLAALEVLGTRLMAQADMEYDELTLRVMNHEMVNAFAVPGAQIVFMKGLIEMADSPEMVAGVLAHEMGHVDARDSLRLMLRAASTAGLLSIAVGDFSGGAGLALVGEQLLTSSYSREAESNADAYAFNLLERSSVDAEPMAEFFRQIMVPGDVSAMMEYFASHPASDGRAERAHDFAQTQTAASGILSDEQWQDLRNICDKTGPDGAVILGSR